MAASAWTPVPADASAWTPVPEDKPEQDDPAQHGAGRSFADASGLSMIGHALAHPLDTASNVVGFAKDVGIAALHPNDDTAASSTNPITQSLRGMVRGSVDSAKQGLQDYKAEGLSEKTRRDFGRAVPVLGPALAQAQAQHDAGNDAGMAGTLAGTLAGLAGPKMLKEAAPVALRGIGRGATAVGETAQDAGTGLINKTVGTLKADFKRGANPGRGYLETGNGPALTMQSIADKAGDAKEAVGNALGEAYENASQSGMKIPVDTVAKEMAKPIQKAIDLETGPGGTGNVAAIQKYVEQFGPTFEKAAANGGFTPKELFDMKQSIAKNTNWSDPAQFSLKAVRQQQTGALSGILSDAIPETSELNQHYQDLTKLVDRATERANTGSRPLTAHIYKAGMAATGALAGAMDHNALAGAAAGAVVDSVPFKTTLATGLYRGGKALADLGGRISPADGTPVVDIPSNDLGNNGATYKPGYPQLPPPGPQELPASSNPTTLRVLPSGYRPVQLPSATAARTPTPSSPPPPFNPATARMRVQPNRFVPNPSPSPSAGTVGVTPEGQGIMPSKGSLPAPTEEAAVPRLTGKALWAQNGARNLVAHGVDEADVETLGKTAKGKRLLVIASSLPPGSPMMKNLVKQVKELIGN